MPTETIVPHADRPDAREQDPRPLAAYTALSLGFLCAVGLAIGIGERSGRLDERTSAADVLLYGVASHKLARLVAREPVTSGVRSPFTQLDEDRPGAVVERPRGRGLRLAVGELVSCPFCLDVWIAGAFTAGQIHAPRVARSVATLLATVAVSDTLQLLHRGLQRRV